MLIMSSLLCHRVRAGFYHWDLYHTGKARLNAIQRYSWCPTRLSYWGRCFRPGLILTSTRPSTLSSPSPTPLPASLSVTVVTISSSRSSMLPLVLPWNNSPLPLSFRTHSGCNWRRSSYGNESNASPEPALEPQIPRRGTM